LGLLTIPSKFLGSTINSHGQVGYLNMPSAFTLKESTLFFGIDRGKPDRKLLLTGSPFEWIDVTIFYVDVGRKAYGGFKQSYKDKGFNLKLQIKEKGFFPAIALGANDIAGTGIFSGEYIVLSNNFNRFEYSFGAGWGKLNGKNMIRNPLLDIANSFRNRNTTFSDRGGNFEIDNYFSGEKISFFSGLAYRLNNHTWFLLEYDSTETPSDVNYKKPSTRVNLGVNFSHNNFNGKIYFNRGNSINLQLSLSQNFLNFKNNGQQKVSRNIDNFQQLQKILALNNIGLQSVKEDDETIQIKVSQNSYMNQYEVLNRVVKNSEKIAAKKDYVEVTIKTLGMEVYSGQLDAREPEYRSGKIQYSENLKTRYIVNEKFPLFNQSISPRIRNFLAAREGFIFQGLILNYDSELLIKENFFFLGNIQYSLYDDFDRLYIPPVDTYPNQVRSDIKKYLNNIGGKPYIGRMELNYFRSFDRKHFLRISAGMYEEMFGGAGAEYQYFPESSIISFGLEAFALQKRDYEMLFKFQDYKNTIIRANMQLSEPKTNTLFKFSYGEYLAGDVGYTFEISRRFDNGVEFGAFFSNTNVPYELYGEGSFDKGIKLKIPFSLFQPNPTLGYYEWHPLTKDPAALLNKSVNLLDKITSMRIY
jgi:hypothetical protein